MKVRKVDFCGGDWLSGTRKLTNEQRGVYITVCALVYDIGGPVPRQEIGEWCMGNARSLNRIIGELVALNKLTITEAGLIDQHRCERELQNARNRLQTLRDVSRNNGAKGGRPPKETNDLENPIARTYQLPIEDSPQTPQGGLSRNRRGEGAPAAMPVEPWQQRCAGWAKNGFWNDFWGPPPDDPRCTAPPDLAADALQRRKRAA